MRCNQDNKRIVHPCTIYLSPNKREVLPCCPEDRYYCFIVCMYAHVFVYICVHGCVVCGMCMCMHVCVHRFVVCGVCVCTCVCLFVCVCTCVHVDLCTPEDNLNHHSLWAIYRFLLGQGPSLVWNSLSNLGCLANQASGICSFCVLGPVVTSSHHHASGGDLTRAFELSR